MEQSATPTSLPKGGKEPQKTKLPTPQELVAHYESQGLNTNEASMKVIDDLQNVLFRVLSSGRGRKDKFMAETSRKLDTANARLTILELKLDSKPGYGESLAIGVAAGTIAREIGNTLPHVVSAFGQMWNTVRGATKS